MEVKAKNRIFTYSKLTPDIIGWILKTIFPEYYIHEILYVREINNSIIGDKEYIRFTLQARYFRLKYNSLIKHNPLIKLDLIKELDQIFGDQIVYIEWPTTNRSEPTAGLCWIVIEDANNIKSWVKIK